MSHSEYEVVVLGGGPAGCAAATLLARRSHKVALVRPAQPAAADLAESIPPSARRILEELGLLEAIERAGFQRNGGNTVWWAGQDVRTESFADGQTGFHTDRGSLEAVLVEAATEAGVTVLNGVTARSSTQREDGWRIGCEGPDGPRDLTASWVIDATGRHGFLARQEGREPDRSTTTLALVRRWRARDGWGGPTADHTLVESYLDGWAWSVPLSSEVRCFTAMVDQRHAELEGGDVAEMLEAELAKTEHVGPARAGAEPEGAAWACPASLYTAQRFGRPGLLLAGDAGSFIDPLSSFGVKKALSSGWLAGVVTHTALVDPVLEAAAVSFFDNRERDVYRSYRSVSADFFESAAMAHATEYWTERAAAAQRSGRDGGEATHDPDRIGVEVPEADVRRAFDEIREKEQLGARPGRTLRTSERPGVVGHRIVLQEHLRSNRYPGGMRYVRGVDLLTLVQVAPAHQDVPDGWSAYNGQAPPVTLPDYLTALATAFAAGFLEHDDR